MTIYILLFLIVFVIQFKIKAKKWDFYDFLLLLILVLMSGLRYGIGTDYYLYSNIYNDSYDLSLMPTNRTGIGFSYLCHYFVGMGLKYENLIMFCSIITIICVYVFLKKYSLRPGLAILIYICLGFYTSSFNGFRQYMSLSLLLIAFIFYRDKKRILSYAFGIISFLIHSSSLFGLLIIWILSNFKKLRIKMRFVYPIFIVISIFYTTLFSGIIVLIKGYENYLTYESIPGVGTFIITLFYFLVTVLLILPHRKELEQKNDINILAINMLIIANCLMLLQLHNWLFSRMIVYLIIFVPIVLSDYYEVVKFKEKKLLSLLFYVVLFSYYLIYVSSFGGVVPYQSILFN